MLPKPTAASSATGGRRSSATPVGDARLLHEIETLSKSLSIGQKSSKPSPKKPPARSISAPKSHPQNPKNHNQKAPKDSSSISNKVKKPSFWSSFNPIKSLSARFRSHRRFGCLFSLHVHSVDNLPPIFSDTTLSVHWTRTTDPQATGLATRPVRVFENSAEFDEILTYACSIYGSRSGPKGSAKYEAKHFLISVKVLDHEILDLGKNLIDLTSFLPVSLEELDEEEGRSGKWSTSFRLWGKARGASLNVSFGFAVIRDDEGDEKKVGRVGSMAMSRDRARLVEDVRVLHEVLPCSKSEARKFDSMKGFLEEGFDREGEDESKNSKTWKAVKECEEPGFTVIEQGVEIAGKDKIGEPESEKIEFRADDGVEVEVNEQVKEMESEMIELGAVERVEATTKDQVSHAHEEESERKPNLQLEDNMQDSGPFCEDPVIEGLDSGSSHPSILVWEKDENVVHIEPRTPAQMSYAEVRSKYKAGAMKSKSLSLDDAAVASEFLSMLGIDHSPFGLSSDSDMESPTERLWKRFMNESLSTSNNIFGTEIGAGKEPEWMDGDFAEDFDLSSIIQEAELELQKANQATARKSRAKMMEDAETEALMHEWGLNDKAFHHSPPGSRSGFGSPIEIPPDEPLEFPPLGAGLGSLFRQRKEGSCSP